MDKITYFDCNCMLGPWREDNGSSFETINDLTGYMKRYGVDEVLVYHTFSKFYHHVIGNKMLDDAVKWNPQIKKCWTVIPEIPENTIPPHELANGIKAEGVCAIRLFPELHMYHLREWIMSDLLSIMEQMRLPVFIDYSLAHWTVMLEWQDIYDICKSYPEIPFILVGLGIGAERSLYKQLITFDNLFFETSYYQANRGIERIVKRFGAVRMLFGTGAPVYDPGCVLSMLHFAEIDHKDRELIAGGNLKNLIRRVSY